MIHLNLRLPAVFFVAGALSFLGFTTFVVPAHAQYLASDMLGHLEDTLNTPLYTIGTANDAPNGRGFNVQVGGVALDLVHHRLFVSDRNNIRVLVFNLDSNNILIDRVADYAISAASLHGGIAGPISQTKVQGRTGLAYDPVNNRLFVTDFFSFRVVVFDVSTITNGMAASYVLGQTNFTSSTSTTSQSGLGGPHGLAYDSDNSRLFVADAGNNRVMIFDVATSTITNGMNAIAVLGQSNFTSSTASTSQTRLSLSSWSALAYDTSTSRLFVSDSGNNRVMIFTVTSTVVNGQAATNVLGQTNFTSSTSSVSQSSLSFPAGGMTYDPVNTRLFVRDSGNRVLVYTVTSTVVNGQAATNVLGQTNFTSSTSTVSQNGVSTENDGGLAFDVTNNRLYMADQMNRRVLIFDTASITDGENAIDLLGQLDENDNPVYTTNFNNNVPNIRGFSSPNASVIDSVRHRLFVPDGSNNRVLVFNLDSSNTLVDRLPDYELGQPSFTTSTARLTQSGMTGPNHVAYDSAGDRLFVSDATNNRVLVFDTSSLATGMNAAYVLGQAGFTSSTAATTATGMIAPAGLAYDSTSHRLFVSESTNNRVMIFDVAPGTIANGEAANYVLGQTLFTTSSTATTASSLNSPRRIAYDSVNARLLVPDFGNNRVLVFDVATSTIVSGEAASVVLGQSSFTAATTSTTQTGMTGPIGVAYDASSTQLFVSESTNNRVLVFNAALLSTGQSASGVIGQSSFTASTAATAQTGVSSPSGLSFDPGTSRLYLAEAGNHRVTTWDFVHISSACPAAGTVGSAYSASLSGASNQGTVTFAVASGSLPSGLSLASNGTLSGNPTASQTYTFSFQATDSNGAIGSFLSPMQSCTMTVFGVPVSVGGSIAPEGSPVSGSTVWGGSGSAGVSVSTTTAPLLVSSSGIASVPSGSSSLSTTVPASAYKFMRNLKRGATGVDVQELQKYLNRNGFTITPTGGGSPGHETTLFGSLTFQALIRFQEFYKNEILIPAGVPSGKGTGFLGPFTRSIMNR